MFDIGGKGDQMCSSREISIGRESTHVIGDSVPRIVLFEGVIIEGWAVSWRSCTYYKVQRE